MSRIHRAMRPTPPLILCFGDSLTAGYQSPSPDNPTGVETPYADVVQERVGAAARVLVSGICGELTGEMVMRFSRDVLERSPAMVVILGGTNDLGWNARPSEIMRNLVTLYERARGARITPIPVTVPSIRVEETGRAEDPGEDVPSEAATWITDHLARRHQLNQLIAEYARSKHSPYFDLYAATADPTTGQLAARYSNDGLHLSTEGYRLFGALLYEQVLAPLLPQHTAGQNATH